MKIFKIIILIILISSCAGRRMIRQDSFTQSIAQISTLQADTKYDEAVKRCQALITEIDSLEQKRVLFNLIGSLYEEQRNYMEAINSYKKAIEISPGSTKMLLALARTYQQAGLLAEAEKVYLRAISQDENNVTAHFGLALTLEKRTLYKKAEAHYRKVLKILPDWQARYRLAWILKHTGRWDEATSQMKLLLTERERPDWWEETGFLYLLRGMKEEARDCFKQAFSLENSGRNLLNLGFTYLVLKDFPQAKEYLCRVINEEGELSGIAHFFYGLILYFEENKDQTKEELESIKAESGLVSIYKEKFLRFLEE